MLQHMAPRWLWDILLLLLGMLLLLLLDMLLDMLRQLLLDMPLKLLQGMLHQMRLQMLLDMLHQMLHQMLLQMLPDTLPHKDQDMLMAIVTLGTRVDTPNNRILVPDNHPHATIVAHPHVTARVAPPGCRQGCILPNGEDISRQSMKKMNHAADVSLVVARVIENQTRYVS